VALAHGKEHPIYEEGAEGGGSIFLTHGSQTYVSGLLEVGMRCDSMNFLTLDHDFWGSKSYAMVQLSMSLFSLYSRTFHRSSYLGTKSAARFAPRQFRYLTLESISNSSSCERRSGHPSSFIESLGGQPRKGQLRPSSSCSACVESGYLRHLCFFAQTSLPHLSH